MSNDSWLSNILQGRGESSALLIALAVGVFGLLTLLQTASGFAWWVLSITYGLVVVATVFTFRAWAWHAIIIEELVKDPKNKEIHDLMKKKRSNVLMRLAVAGFAEGDKRDLISRIFIPATFVIIIVIGALLWVAIAKP